MKHRNRNYRTPRNVVRSLLALGIAATASSAMAGQADTSQLRDGQQYDRFIVKFVDGGKAGVSTDTQLKRSLGQAISNAGLANAKGGNVVTASKLRRMALGADVVRTSRKLDRVEAEILMRQLAADPNVAYVQVDAMKKAALVPNDTYYNGYQWHYKNGAGGINAPTAWDSATGAGVVVAVLDTGITSHSDLDANILPGYDFIDDTFVSRDGDGRDANPLDEGDWLTGGECNGTNAAQDSSWHGTHVTGTIATVTNNAKGMAGVAYDAKIVPVRVLGRCGGYTSDIVDGMVWAAGGSVAGIPANANPAEVINMSLGGGGPCSTAEIDAINFVRSQGTTVVVAAGNESDNVANYSPANCPGVITVGANKYNGGISWYSNYGSGIDLAGPGGEGSADGNPNGWIWSTWNSGTTVPAAESYIGFIGTSQATPHVAAVVALMQSVATTPLTPDEVLALLKATARPFPVAIPAGTPLGAGIVDAAAAVNAVINGGEVPTPLLANGVPVGGNNGSAGQAVTYMLEVPAGAKKLTIISYGGSGNADLFVKRGSEPSTSSYDKRSARPGNNETVSIPNPVAGTYYVTLIGSTSFSNVTVRASFTAP